MRGKPQPNSLRSFTRIFFIQSFKVKPTSKWAGRGNSLICFFQRGVHTPKCNDVMDDDVTLSLQVRDRDNIYIYLHHLRKTKVAAHQHMRKREKKREKKVRKRKEESFYVLFYKILLFLSKLIGIDSNAIT